MVAPCSDFYQPSQLQEVAWTLMFDQPCLCPACFITRIRSFQPHVCRKPSGA